MDETLNYEWGTEPNQLIRIKNAIGEIYEIEYDKSGLIEKEKGFDSREISFKYDNAGNRIMTTNGCGEVIKYEYNDAGLMTRQILPDGSEAEFKYDALGNVIQARNDHCTIALERDMLGRVTKETQNNIFIKRYYDIAGNRKSLESSVGDQFYYEYDTNNMLTELIINKEYKMHFEYDERGFEVCRNLPGYIAVVQDRDIMGRLNSQTVKKQYNHEPLTPNESIGPIISRKYEYVNSKLQAVNDTLRGTTRYIYDPLDRIISMEANNFRETFKYNKINALVEKTINENKYTLAFAKSGQVQSDGNSRYSYDDHGRLISCIKGDGTDYQSESHFRWNGLDQLVEARISDGEIWRYKYDPFGRRIEKSGNGRVINYIWDEDVIIHEIEVADKPLVTTWVFDVQSFRPLGKVNKKGCYSIVTDQRNIPLEMIDKYGNIVWAAEFFAWGTQAKSYSSESNCPIRFHGQWFDVETGFHYNLFRYYDPSIGRYICQDPIGLHGGMDLYGYARNPIEYCDPYGLQPPNVGDIHPQTGNEILASQEYGSPGDFMVEAAKPSMRGRLVQTHLYEDPGHHNPHGGINPYNPNKSVLPPNHIELFNSSIVHDGNRYAMDAHGNIHQFQPSTRGQHPVFHWAGQENGRTASGRPVSLVVPREARRKLMAQCEPDDG
jgi:RHS repeat-associated protein